jgi:hypothetical protein
MFDRYGGHTGTCPHYPVYFKRQPGSAEDDASILETITYKTLTCNIVLVASVSTSSIYTAAQDSD